VVVAVARVRVKAERRRDGGGIFAVLLRWSGWEWVVEVLHYLIPGFGQGKLK
jgi:hypothetical protein